jgi:hypothetical protein
VPKMQILVSIGHAACNDNAFGKNGADLARILVHTDILNLQWTMIHEHRAEETDFQLYRPRTTSRFAGKA